MHRRWTEALRNYTRALSIYRKKGNEKGKARSYNNIGTIHDNQGRYARAMEFYEKSLAIKKRLGNRSGIAFTRFSMGGLAYMQGNLDLAIRYLEEARDIFRSLGSPHVKVAEKALRIYRRKAGR